MRFKGKFVLVTGAVRNTGLAIAEAFAREGASVILNGRKPGDVAREAARLRESYGGDIIEAPADISNPDQVAGMFDTIARQCAQLDVLVNNAIIQGVGHSLIDTPPEFLEEVFRVNVFGAYYCSQQAARMMVAEGTGAIVNIGSNTASRAIRNRTAYIASKGAVEALTRAMAVELAPSGVRVNHVVAGYIHTPRWDALDDTEAERRRQNIPLGREAEGGDIAAAVMFLASENAVRITGTGIVVDGGTLAQLVPADCDM